MPKVSFFNSEKFFKYRKCPALIRATPSQINRKRSKQHFHYMNAKTITCAQFCS